jgi:LysM repeat protein
MRALPFLLFVSAGFSASCSPIRSSPYDPGHQLEISLHEVQTHLDELRHDISCVKAEFQIIDSRLRTFEQTLAHFKQQNAEHYFAKIDHLASQLTALEKKYGAQEASRATQSKDVESLVAHSQDTSSALKQFRQRIEELESALHKQSIYLEEVAKGKGFKTREYTVRSGDSLEKIARHHGTTVEAIKQLNNLSSDLIVAGQRLSLPSDPAAQTR